MAYWDDGIQEWGRERKSGFKKHIEGDYYLRILGCNTPRGLLLRLAIFLLTIARPITNGFASRAGFECLWLCPPFVARRTRTRCAWVGRMFLNDSLTLGSGQTHVRSSIFVSRQGRSVHKKELSMRSITPPYIIGSQSLTPDRRPLLKVENIIKPSDRISRFVSVFES
jgi:hypothetical protein